MENAVMRWQVSRQGITRVIDTVLVPLLSAHFRDIFVWKEQQKRWKSVDEKQRNGRG